MKTDDLPPLLAVATVAGSLSATPAQAHSAACGAGVAAGLIGGAIVGGAIAASRPFPITRPARPMWQVPGGPGCYWSANVIWDGYDWRFRRVEVCN